MSPFKSSYSVLETHNAMKFCLLNVLILSMISCMAYQAVISSPLPISSNKPSLFGAYAFSSNQLTILINVDLHFLPPLRMFECSFQLIQGIKVVGMIGLETYAPKVSQGYFALSQTTIMPEYESPVIIQGFCFVILKKLLLTILSIAQAVSSMICQMVKYFKFLVRQESSPKGLDSPKYLGQRQMKAPFKLVVISRILTQLLATQALVRGGTFKKMGVDIFIQLISRSTTSLCFQTLFQVLSKWSSFCFIHAVFCPKLVSNWISAYSNFTSYFIASSGLMLFMNMQQVMAKRATSKKQTVFLFFILVPFFFQAFCYQFQVKIVD